MFRCRRWSGKRCSFSARPSWQAFIPRFAPAARRRGSSAVTISRKLPSALLALTVSLVCAASWRAVRPGKTWSFPQDHWAHPEFHVEWWYFTGILEDVSSPGRCFGYQFTFFRVGLLPEEPDLDSRWTTRQLLMGHAAVGDFAAGRHTFSDLLYREIPLLSGFGTYPDP